MRKIILYISVTLIRCCLRAVSVQSAAPYGSNQGMPRCHQAGGRSFRLNEQNARHSPQRRYEVSSVPALRLHIVEIPSGRLSMLIKYQSDPRSKGRGEQETQVEKYKGTERWMNHLYSLS